MTSIANWQQPKVNRLDPWPTIAERAAKYTPMFVVRLLGARSGCYCHPHRPIQTEDELRKVIDDGVRDFLGIREADPAADPMELESICAALHIAVDTAFADPMSHPEHAARAEAERCRASIRASIRRRLHEVVKHGWDTLARSIYGHGRNCMMAVRRRGRGKGPVYDRAFIRAYRAIVDEEIDAARA